MNLLLTEIINIINNGNKINDNIVGINYLEKIKYLIINNFKENQDKFIIDNLISELKKQNSQSKKLEFKNQSLTLTVNLYKDSLSSPSTPPKGSNISTSIVSRITTFFVS